LALGHVKDNGRQQTVVTAISKIPERAVAREACLVVIYGADMGKRYALDRPQIIIGRSSSADIQVDQEAVSRNHCKVLNLGEHVLIRDLESTNGTYVNDEAVKERVLQDGDLVKVGSCILKFLSGSNIESAYHEEIYRLTTVDGLTQIFNRRYFSEALEREVSRANRYVRDLSLIMFDIDRFKVINDTYGHLAGDHVLRMIAGIIRTRIRREDVFARYGGEEFGIILPEIDNPHALVFAEKVRALVAAAEFDFEGCRIAATVSLGVATLSPQLTDHEAFIRIADEFLYTAKEDGRNRVKG
jgi:diguanylate cyclase (GGDEF)-like protein